MKKQLIPILLIVLPSLKTFSQIPKEVPHPDNNSPLDFNNPADIIIYIVIPVLFIVLYFVGRRMKRKK